MTNAEYGEYVRVLKQLVSHPVAEEQKEKINLSGKDARKYSQKLNTSNVQEFSVVEVAMGDYVLEMNSNASNFEDILATFQFTDMTNPDRPLTHWDVREKRICTQMITYAREGEGASCQAFSTPCDVPDSWQICDGASQ